VEYIPSKLRLYENLNKYNTSQQGLEVDSLVWLEACFPGLKPDANGIRPSVDWNADGSISSTFVDLEGSEVLVFALGGINYPTLGYQGFSTNSKNPAAGPPTQNEQRIGPFVQFQTTRLVALNTAGGAAGYKAYQNTWKLKAQPYAYFSSYGKLNGYARYGNGNVDCASLASLGLTQGPYTSAANKYWNEKSFQIISAGEDGVFGPGGMWPPSPGGAADDDMTNFAKGVLSGGSTQ
jgi:hypothetical protein